MKKFYTDYPFHILLGDKPKELAPIREIEVVNYDGDKYCDIIVGGVGANIKIGYIYLEPKRCGETRCITEKDLIGLDDKKKPNIKFHEA